MNLPTLLGAELARSASGHRSVRLPARHAWIVSLLTAAILLSDGVRGQIEPPAALLLLEPVVLNEAEGAALPFTFISPQAALDARAAASGPDTAQPEDLQDGALALARAAYGEDHPALLQALEDHGDWNLRAFLTLSDPSLNILRTTTSYGSNFAGTSGNRNGTTFVMVNPEVEPFYKLYQAYNSYLEAINMLVARQELASPALPGLERKLLSTLFLRTHQENIRYEPDFYLNRKTTATGTRLDTSDLNLIHSEDYKTGLESLQRRMAYLTQNDARTPEQVASTILDEADWELLFTRTRRAEEKYAAAQQFFIDNPQMTATIADLVQPATPVVLPAFLPAPNSRKKLGLAADAEVSYFGYFDVAFSINKKGRARRVKILNKGGNVTSNMELRLNEYLKSLTFRPRYKDGLLDTGTLTLRYYVGY